MRLKKLFSYLYLTRVIDGSSSMEYTDNPLCNVKEPKYYHGDTCEKFWLCYNGQESPTMSCPGTDLVYNPIMNGCDLKANSVCPGDDLRGHIDPKMIFPELVVHSTCGYRHRNGDYDLHKDMDAFMTLDLCGFKQSCSNDGKLSIRQCPVGKLWNNETDVCVPTKEMKVCEPSTKWTKQRGIDLEECLGLVDGRCEIGFVELDRAKKYCEHTGECIGIKEMPCNKISVNMDCIGTFWRPFIAFVQSVSDNEVYIFQRGDVKIESDNESNDLNTTEQYQHNYSDSEILYYSGCADGYYNQDGSCSMTFDTADKALRHCDKYKTCEGIAKEGFRTGYKYTAVGHVSDNKLHFEENQKRGEVTQKLNRLIHLALDYRTENTMLTEQWLNDEAVDLEICTKVVNGRCLPNFDNRFEAQYYCEFLGDDCVGVSENNGTFHTMKKIAGKSQNNSTSSIKAMWCSDSTPPFSVKLPSVFSASNQVRVMWPVVNLKEMFDLMGHSNDDFLSRVWKSQPMRQADYNRFALDVVVMADTVIADKNLTVYNIRSLKIVARKLIVKESWIAFRQVDIISTWEPNDKAANPDPGSCPTKEKGYCHGINGKNGEVGFGATTIELDFGCINGKENDLKIETFSGNGGKGQHASSGTEGLDGAKEKDLRNFKRKNKCHWFTSCKDCCHGLEEHERSAHGRDSRQHGSSGGNGGIGGDGGAPGNHNKIVLSVAKGLPQHFNIFLGNAGHPGRKGKHGLAGRQGLGGYGESCKCSRVGGGYVFATSCPGQTRCDLKGKDGPINWDGMKGKDGVYQNVTDSYQVIQTIDTKHLIDADVIHQDFMLKYAVMLMNNDTINESQEILYFLAKFKSITGSTASQLLNIMNKNGRMESDVKVIAQQNFEFQHSRLRKIVQRGQRLENTLNAVGEIFDFTHMFYSLVDTVLEVVEEELVEIREEKQETEQTVIDSYNAMLQMNRAVEIRTFGINDDIDRLIFCINAQINSLYRAAKRAKRMSCVAAIFSCIPGIPMPGVKNKVQGAVGNSAKIWMYDSIMKELDKMHCDDLHILSFMNEFIYDFAQLGDDVACLRTPEDFKNFERGALQEFFSGDLLAHLESEEMWMDTQCLIGLVEVPTIPPNFGLLPRPKDYLPALQIFDKVTDIKHVIKGFSQIIACLSKSGMAAKSTCFMTNCKTIVKGLNVFLDTGIDCELLDFEILDEIIEGMQAAKDEIEKVVGNIEEAADELKDVLETVGDIVIEINNFFSTIDDLVHSEVFDGMQFNNFFEFFTAVVENLEELMVEFPDFDFEGFYKVAKRIYDFLNDKDFEKWSEVIVESLACDKQINKIEQCIAEMKSTELKEVIKSNFTDFDAMREEINKLDCLQKMSITSCINVKKLLVENPSFDNLNKIQTLFAEFASKTYDLQSKMHDRIEYLENLYNDKPTMCEQTQKIDGIASLTQTLELALPRILDKIRKLYGETKRFKASTYGIIAEIPDYSDEIKSLSNKIMRDIQTNAQESMAKMGFVLEDLLGKQINLLKVQIRENLYQSLHDRFSAGIESLSGKLEHQVELFHDVYQLYTFVQSRAFDSFVQLNDRFEYETLWRYPTGQKLREIIRDNYESDNGDIIAGRMSTFTKFEQLSLDFGQEYEDYKTKVLNGSSGVFRKVELPENVLLDFYFDGAFQIHMNPSDQDCMNCFNARLEEVKIVLDEPNNCHFNFTHLGTEMQLRMENGFRRAETIKSLPESYSVTSGEISKDLNNRSPFANFFIEQKSVDYVDCQKLPTEAEQKECRYELRKKIKSISVEFVISYIPNFPDQHEICIVPE